MNQNNFAVSQQHVQQIIYQTDNAFSQLCITHERMLNAAERIFKDLSKTEISEDVKSVSGKIHEQYLKISEQVEAIQTSFEEVVGDLNMLYGMLASLNYADRMKKTKEYHEKVRKGEFGMDPSQWHQPVHGVPAGCYGVPGYNHPGFNVGQPYPASQPYPTNNAYYPNSGQGVYGAAPGMMGQNPWGNGTGGQPVHKNTVGRQAMNVHFGFSRHVTQEELFRGKLMGRIKDWGIKVHPWGYQVTGKLDGQDVNFKTSEFLYDHSNISELRLPVSTIDFGYVALSVNASYPSGDQNHRGLIQVDIDHTVINAATSSEPQQVPPHEFFKLAQHLSPSSVFYKKTHDLVVGLQLHGLNHSILVVVDQPLPKPEATQPREGSQSESSFKSIESSTINGWGLNFKDGKAVLEISPKLYTTLEKTEFHGIKSVKRSVFEEGIIFEMPFSKHTTNAPQSLKLPIEKLMGIHVPTELFSSEISSFRNGETYEVNAGDLLPLVQFKTAVDKPAYRILIEFLKEIPYEKKVTVLFHEDSKLKEASEENKSEEVPNNKPEDSGEAK